MKQFHFTQLILAATLSSAMALTGCVKRPPDPLPAKDDKTAKKDEKKDGKKQDPTADAKGKKPETTVGSNVPANPSDPSKPTDPAKPSSGGTTTSGSNSGSAPSGDKPVTTSSAPSTPGQRTASDKPSREVECDKPIKEIEDALDREKRELLQGKESNEMAQALHKAAQILVNAAKADADFTKKAKELSDSLNAPRTTSASDAVPVSYIPELAAKLVLWSSQALKDSGLPAGQGNLFHCTLAQDKTNEQKEIKVLCPIQAEGSTVPAENPAKDSSFDGAAISYDLALAEISVLRGKNLAEKQVILGKDVYSHFAITARDTTGFCSKPNPEMVDQYNSVEFTAVATGSKAVIRFANVTKSHDELKIVKSMDGDEKIPADKRGNIISERFKRFLGVPASCFETEAKPEEKKVEEKPADAEGDSQATEEDPGEEKTAE